MPTKFGRMPSSANNIGRPTISIVPSLLNSSNEISLRALTTVELRNFASPLVSYIYGCCHKLQVAQEQIFTITPLSSSCYLLQQSGRQCGSLGGKRCSSLITGRFVCGGFESMWLPSLSGADCALSVFLTWFHWNANIPSYSVLIQYFSSL